MKGRSTNVSVDRREAVRIFHLLGKDGETFAKSAEKMVLKTQIPGRALQLGAEISSSAESENPTTASFTIPYVVVFYHTVRD